jgi:excisionase family DNA binding protein
MPHPVPPANRTRPPGAPWPLDEAAEFLHVSKRHLNRLIDGRKAKALRLGRRVMLADSEVRRLAEQGTD